MKQAIADTSALVSLAFSGRLEEICKAMALLIPLQVKKELEEIAERNDAKASAAKMVLELIKTGKITIKNIAEKNKVQNLLGKDIDFGEAECFELAFEQKTETILMDDLDASYALAGMARAQSISIRISAAAVIELAKQKIISKTEAKKSLLKMIQHRGWEKTTLEYLIQKYFD